jgi:hypothetical protein
MRVARFLPWLLFSLPALGQTTQGIIAGRVTQLSSGQAIPAATISWTNTGTNARGTQRSSLSGDYALAPLSPGTYVLRVEADGFQARELHEVQVAVAGRIDLDFALRALSETLESVSARPVSLPNNPFRVTIFGPDVEIMTAPIVVPREEQSLLDSTRSQLIEPGTIRDLPFFGRDIYTMLVMQPGVSSDGGTVRGLGLSIDGQRPSSANFFLDGIEANNYLLSGPSLAVAPEAVEEYRVSMGNYSGEFGFSSGYIANAITRSGTNSWHGTAWFYLKNEALDANEFQNNRQGLARPTLREFQPGYQLGGPLRSDRYFISSSFDYLHSQDHSPAVTINLPTSLLIASTAADSIARKLLQQFPPPVIQSDTRLAAPFVVEQPVTVNRWTALERFDSLSRGGTERVMARLAVAQSSQPDFIWSPYKDFVSGLSEPVLSLAGSLASSIRPRLSNDFRFGWSRNTIDWNRAHPEIPTLIDSSPQGVLLPGSLAFYAFRNRNNTYQLSDEVFRVFGRHIVRFGGDFLLRYQEGFLSAGRDGRYAFPTVVDFAADLPSEFSVTLHRKILPGLSVPDFERRYRYHQVSGFLQDTWRVSPAWTLNLGVRYEFFGDPVNTGAQKDAIVTLGAGTGLPAQLTSSQLTFPSGGNQSLYRTPAGNWSFRIGVSHDLFGNGRTVFRGGSGVFYDRPFDDIWQSAQSNNLALTTFDYQAGPGGYLTPVSAVLPRYSQQPVITDFPPVTLFQTNWKTGYAITQFLGVQQRIAENWSIEAQGVVSVGRHLLTTDQINRPFSLSASSAEPDNYNRSYSPLLPIIYYRGSQGSSNYDALSAMVRYRAGRYRFNLAYSWSHSIDNQSDPLAGNFLDLNFVSLTPTSAYSRGGTFSRQFDSRADRGNSDFDQRHNLVLYSIWDMPSPRHWRRLLGGWKVAQMAAFRSGFPFSIYAPSSPTYAGGIILNNRANASGAGLLASPAPVAGGSQIIDTASFSIPIQGQLGSAGRNAFRGPGFYNVDLSISRSLTVRAMGEATRLTLRADLFNLLNHANLGQPDSLITSPAFGTALYGRIGTSTGFPALTPFRETARQVQLLIRLEF